jgi:hypothetical protein
MRRFVATLSPGLRSSISDQNNGESAVSTVLIAAIVLLVFALFGAGYLWLVRMPRNARHRSYQDGVLAATRNYRANPDSRHGADWR